MQSRKKRTLGCVLARIQRCRLDFIVRLVHDLTAVRERAGVYISVFAMAQASDPKMHSLRQQAHEAQSAYSLIVTQNTHPPSPSGYWRGMRSVLPSGCTKYTCKVRICGNTVIPRDRSNSADQQLEKAVTHRLTHIGCKAVQSA